METEQLPLEDALMKLSGSIRAMQDLAFQQLGESRATRVVLDAVIASHPNPRALFDIWQRATPELAQELIGTENAPEGPVLEGWTAILSHYSELIEAVFQRRVQDS